jgi:hypothetical protein
MEQAMHKPLLFPLLALGAAACAYDGPPPEPSPRVQAEFAEALAGRVPAGPPVSCVSQRDLGGNRSIGQGVILFNGRSSDLVYVNRPAAGCPEIRSGRALVVRTTSSQLCRGDIVDVVDLTTGMGFGGCGLGDFEPFRRVESR